MIIFLELTPLANMLRSGFDERKYLTYSLRFQYHTARQTDIPINIQNKEH